MNKRFGKADWLTLGLKQLAASGSRGLGLEALCEASGKTRGSFYHHFPDHSAFILDLMEEWKRKNTLEVADSALKEPPEDQGEQLTVLATALDQDLERAVRQFAQSNETARQVLREVDELRTRFIAQIYKSQGYDPASAVDIARIEYAAFVGTQLVWPDLSQQEILRLVRRFNKMVELAAARGDSLKK